MFNWKGRVHTSTKAKTLSHHFRESKKEITNPGSTGLFFLGSYPTPPQFAIVQSNLETDKPQWKNILLGYGENVFEV